MQTPSWFDQSYYLSIKLGQLQQSDPTMTMFAMEKAMADLGLTPYQHFLEFGAKENLAPNAFFNVGEYLQAKANELNKAGGSTVYSAAMVLSAIEQLGLSPWEHYVQFGSSEGVNPSNAFDEAGYLELKLENLRANEPDVWGKKTVDDVRAAFTANGLTALDHYLTFGKAEGFVTDESQLVAKNPVAPSPVKPAEYKLTEDRDTLNGTSGNDLFTGNDKTWTLADSITGGTGTDTLRLTSVDEIKKGEQTVTGVEVLDMTNLSSVDVTADVSEFAGLEKIAVNGAKDVTLTAGKTVTDVTLSNVAGTTVTVNGDGVNRLSLNNVKDDTAVVTLTNTTADHDLKLVLNNVGDLAGNKGVEVVDAQAKNLNVVANGDAAVDLTVVKAENISITGTGDLYIGNSLTGGVLKDINAAAMQGDLTIATSLGTGIAFTGGVGADDVKVGATTKSILTGAGNDTVRLDASAVGTGGLIDGGAGTDTLSMDFANAAIVGANFTTQVKNFEVLHLGANSGTGAAAIVDMDLFAANNAINTVVVDASTKAFTVQNIADKSTVQLTGDMDEAISLLVKDAGAVGHNNDTMNLILGTDKAGADVAGLTVTDLENLNITSQGAANTIGGLSGLTANGTVTIKGDMDLSLTTGSMGVAATFNAEAFKGDLTLDASANAKDVKVLAGAGDDTLTGGAGNDIINGGAGNDTIIGGAGADMIKGGAGADTLTGGAGKDTFVYGATSESIAASMDTITDFTKADDKIDLSAANGVKVTADTITAVQTAVGALGAGSTLADALNAAANANTTNNGVVWFEHSGNTYVYQEVAGSGTTSNANDLVIELTGTSLGLADGNFVYHA